MITFDKDYFMIMTKNILKLDVVHHMKNIMQSKLKIALPQTGKQEGWLSQAFLVRRAFWTMNHIMLQVTPARKTWGKASNWINIYWLGYKLKAMLELLSGRIKWVHYYKR